MPSDSGPNSIVVVSVSVVYLLACLIVGRGLPRHRVHAIQDIELLGLNLDPSKGGRSGHEFKALGKDRLSSASVDPDA